MKHGFERLRGMAAAGAVGVSCLLGAGTGRAAVTTTPINVTRGTPAFTWSSIGNLTSVLHDQSVTTPGGFSLTTGQSAFGINDGTTDNGSDFYDFGMGLAVGNVLFVNPGTTVDLTGDTLTTNTASDIIPGVDAQIQYYFHPTRSVVRGLYSLTNTTDADIDTSALVMGNYGSDSNTTVQATSDGDLVVEDSDMWIVSNDNTTVGDEGSDPTATVSSYGEGATVLPIAVMKPGTPAGGADGGVDNFGFRYDVTIPAGETVRIMVFNQMSPIIADAVAAGADFESIAAADAAGLMTGIDDTMLCEIVNYGDASCAPEPEPEPTRTDDGDGLFALGLPTLLGLAFPMLFLRRRKGRNDAR